MRLAITGGTGLVGQFLVSEALASGDAVTLLGRAVPGWLSGRVLHQPWELRGPAPDLRGIDALVHCAPAARPGALSGR